MKKILILLSAALAAASCGGSGTKSGDGGAKLQYRPEENRVEVMTLKRSDFPIQILSNGKITASRKAALSFSTSGTIIYVAGVNGGRVGKGAIVARLDRPDLDLALEGAQIALEKAKLDYLDRMAGLGYAPKDTATAPAEVKEMARMRSGYTSARNALAKARLDESGALLRAPFSGVIADMTANVWGQAPSGPFCTLIDDSSFDVTFTVMESDYSRISKGMDIRVSPFSGTGKEYKGKITGINPVVGKNGLIAVTGSVPGGSGLIDGMNVHVIMEKAIAGKLTVPKNAVVIRDNLDVLFTYTEDGTAHWTYVNILETNAESYAVEANTARGATLSEGDRVITSGNLNLADGSKVILTE